MSALAPAGTALPPVASTIPVRPGETPWRDLRLRFTGSTMEYFRIWIVNVCLTLLTLGIFSAWAKVRKKRYFYSHTLLDGTPFQYLGQPIPILKGRLIGALVLAVWYFATHIMMELVPYVLGAAAILAPWVLVRSAAFNARYSAYRNMTFHFGGTYWSAVKVIYGWAIPVAAVIGVGGYMIWTYANGAHFGSATVVFFVMVLSIAFGAAWWHQRLKRYMVTQTSYGGVAAEFNATPIQFLKKYFFAGLIAMGGSTVVGALSSMLLRADGGGRVSIAAVTIVSYAMSIALFTYIRTRITNLVWNNARMGPLRFESRLRARSLIGLYFVNAAAILCSAGLLIPWATMRTLKYRVESFTVSFEGELAEFQGSDKTTVRAAGAEVGDLLDFDMSI